MNNVKSSISQMSMPEHVLYDYITLFPEAAHLKDIKNKKYIYSNKQNLKIYGLDDPEKIIGLTVNDLDEFMRPYWGKGFSNQINEFDNHVAKEIVVLFDKNRIFLDKFGFVHIQNMTKTPIANNSNKITAILTTSFEVTEQFNKISLFEIYKKIYPKKRNSCFYFMRYLKIDSLFYEILSPKEMHCLLLMLENKNYKYLAQKMCISNKTIESHIRNILFKTRINNLNEILEYIKKSKNAHD